MSFSVANTPRLLESLGSTAAGAAASRAARLQVMALSALPDLELSEEIAADASYLGISPLDSTRSIEWTSSDRIEPTASQRASVRALQHAHESVTVSGDPGDFKRLLELSLSAPTAIERVISAQSLYVLSGAEHAAAAATLDDAERSTSDEVRAIASLARDAPDRERFDPESEGSDPLPLDAGTPPPPVNPLSTTIHGTWARVSAKRWYVPGAPLHTHILHEASPDLYAGTDHFRWTSAYDNDERLTAGAQLVEWVKDQGGSAALDSVYAHSHGGNVALSAAAAGLKIKMLVLMHVPPRRRSRNEWEAIRRNVERTLVYRVRLDRVVMADMLRAGATPNGAVGQRFRQKLLPHVDSEPHPTDGPWFDHGFWVDVENWKSHGIANDVAFHRRRSPMK